MHHFSYNLVYGWPELAWIAECRRGDRTVTVRHGAGVETHDHWFCEAVWDAPFEHGDFDLTDIVFGSGARQRDGTTCFVSSAATVDRLHVYEESDRKLISNSLPCLVSAVVPYSGSDPAAELANCAGSDYLTVFTSIANGIENCASELVLGDLRIRLVYFRNMRWDGYELRESPKPACDVRLDTFADYVAFMTGSVQRIGRNMSGPERRVPLSWLGTISRGFDSSTCVALARAGGLRRAISFSESRPGVHDAGVEIGMALGVDVQVLDRLAWHGSWLWEPLFVVADGQGKEISQAGAHDSARHTVLLTGHAGDYTWSKSPKTPTTDLYRGGYSGVSLSEYRLHAGFIHLALPFVGMTRVADIVRISNSDEMAQWSSGDAYDRPICNRILESAGVSRDLFGQSKTGNSVRFVIGEDPWSHIGRREYRRWLRLSRREGRLSGRVVASLMVLDALLGPILRARTHLKGLPLRIANAARRRLAGRIRRLGGWDRVFEWALEHVVAVYRNGVTADDDV